MNGEREEIGITHLGNNESISNVVHLDTMSIVTFECIYRYADESIDEAVRYKPCSCHWRANVRDLYPDYGVYSISLFDRISLRISR